VIIRSAARAAAAAEIALRARPGGASLPLDKPPRGDDDGDDDDDDDDEDDDVDMHDGADGDGAGDISGDDDGEDAAVSAAHNLFYGNLVPAHYKHAMPSPKQCPELYAKPSGGAAEQSATELLEAALLAAKGLSPADKAHVRALFAARGGSGQEALPRLPRLIN